MAALRRRIHAHSPLLLVGLCAGVACAARDLVSADTLPDGADLAITFAALTMIAIAFCVVVHRRSARPLATRFGTVLVLAGPVAVLAVGAVFVARSYADTCVEVESLISASEPAGPEAVIALGPLGDDVRLAGEIRVGDAARLEALLDANPKVTRIHLTSEGGVADEGQALGEVIASHDLTTYVPDYCVSACTLAFVAARERLAMQGARLGFHAPFEQGLFGQTFRGDPGAVRTAYAAAGIAPRFIDEALAVGSADMWFPPPDRLLAAGVVTSFVDRGRLPDSNLDFDPTPAGARATVLSNFPILSGLDDAEPALVDRIAGWYLEAYRHGWSEGRIVVALRTLSDSAVALAVAGADDASLVDLARFIAKALQTAEPRDCEAIGTRGDLITAAAILGREDPGATDVAADLVEAAMKEPRHTVVTAEHGGTATLVIYGSDAATRGCVEIRRNFATALALPTAAAAALLRPRFSDWARRSVGPLAAAISEETH